MEPAFRVLTIRTRRLDEVMYDSFPVPGRDSWGTETFFCMVSLAYLFVQVFIWGLDSMKPWNWLLVVVSGFVTIITLRVIYEKKHFRGRYLDAEEAKRKEKSERYPPVTAVLFYGDHLVQYDLVTGKTLRLEYEEVGEIKPAADYVFLISKDGKNKICLELDGFSGKFPKEALRWLAARTGCKLPKYG